MSKQVIATQDLQAVLALPYMQGQSSRFVNQSTHLSLAQYYALLSYSIFPRRTGSRWIVL